MHSVLIQGRNPSNALIPQMFALRAKVFRDILGWNVEVVDGLEFDRFDDLGPIYVLVIDDNIVVGSLRLLPTAGPTLMAACFAEAGVRSSPDLWECSRVCYLPSTKKRQLRVSICLNDGLKKFISMTGATSLVGNFDARMMRLYAQAGFTFDILGETSCYGEPVYLGIFQISAEILDKVNAKLTWYHDALAATA